MRRIYWDSMLFIYWTEFHPVYSAKIEDLFERSMATGDEICTSILTIGEVLVVPIREQNFRLKSKTEAFFESDVVTVLPIDHNVVGHFAQLRANIRIEPADALHLACARVHGCEVFVTNDKALQRFQIPGIRQIAGIDDRL